jgi:hypothetical protein
VASPRGCARRLIASSPSRQAESSSAFAGAIWSTSTERPLRRPQNARGRPHGAFLFARSAWDVRETARALPARGYASTVLKEAAGLTDRHHRTILVISTVVPGSLILSAAIFLSVPSGKRESFRESVSHVFALFPEGFTAVLFPTTLVLLFAAFALGLASRTITFWILRRCTPGHHETPSELLRAMNELFDADLVENAFSKNFAPLWGLLQSAPSRETPKSGVPNAESPSTRAVDTPSALDREELLKRSTEIFDMAKLWLRTRAPGLSVDDLELEINAAWTSVLPLALFIPVTLRWLPPGGGLVTGVLIGWLVVLGALVRLGVRSRRSEHLSALKRFFWAQWVVEPSQVDPS